MNYFFKFENDCLSIVDAHGAVIASQCEGDIPIPDFVVNAYAKNNNITPVVNMEEYEILQDSMDNYAELILEDETNEEALKIFSNCLKTAEENLKKFVKKGFIKYSKSPLTVVGEVDFDQLKELEMFLQTCKEVYPTMKESFDNYSNFLKAAKNTSNFCYKFHKVLNQ